MKWSGSFWFLVVGLWLLVRCNSNKESNTDYRSAEEIQIIPQPNRLKLDSGYFTINKETIIWIDSNLLNAVDLLHLLGHRI